MTELTYKGKKMIQRGSVQIKPFDPVPKKVSGYTVPKPIPKQIKWYFGKNAFIPIQNEIIERNYNQKRVEFSILQ